LTGEGRDFAERERSNRALSAAIHVPPSVGRNPGRLLLPVYVFSTANPNDEDRQDPIGNLTHNSIIANAQTVVVFRACQLANAFGTGLVGQALHCRQNATLLPLGQRRNFATFPA